MGDTEEIKSRLDVAELIGQSVALKKAGRTLKGLCPFHAEKTPSFVVWPDEGSWKCFGCGEGGDAFTYLMKREHLEFGEAKRILAEKTGVELQSGPRHDPQQEEANQRLYQALQAAALYYHGLLKGGVGATARAYLGKRGLSPETIDAYLLGYAPQQSGALERHLMTSGFSVDELEAAGLVGQGDHGRFDWFRNRVLFPIRDVQGRVIGFGGRGMSDDVQPKYLNSPQTAVFDKGGILYGLDRARQAIRAEGRAVVVEGYMDVLALHQHGFVNAVAALGTSITERHLDQLRRLTSEIVLALDADAAGRLATRRGIEVARALEPDEVVPEIGVEQRRGGLRSWVRYRAMRKLQLKVAELPAGLDPDDLVRQDAGRWRTLVAAAEPVVDFALARLAASHDLQGAEGKAAAADEALALIRELVDPVERSHHLQRVARLLDLDERVLAERMGRPARERHGPEAEREATAGNALDEYTLALAGRLGPMAVGELAAEHLETAEARALLDVLRRLGQIGTLKLEQLPQEAGPALAEAAGRVVAHAQAWDLVPEERHARELERARLELEARALFRTQRQLQSLVSQSDEDEEQRGRWYTTLAELTGRLQAVQRGLAAHGQVRQAV